MPELKATPKSEKVANDLLATLSSNNLTPGELDYVFKKLTQWKLGRSPESGGNIDTTQL